MANDIYNTNSIFKMVYKDKFLGEEFLPPIKKVKNTKLAKKLYAGKIVGYDLEYLLVENENYRG